MVYVRSALYRYVVCRLDTVERCRYGFYYPADTIQWTGIHQVDFGSGAGNFDLRNCDKAPNLSNEPRQKQTTGSHCPVQRFSVIFRIFKKYFF